MSLQYTIGIDEAGRGPLAGPVSVGIVVIPQGFDWTQIENVRDSKKLSEKKRDAVFAQVKEMAANKLLMYSVGFSSAEMIDAHGIVRAIQSAMARALKNLPVDPADCEVLLDGSLVAPAHFTNQRTIIGGDDSEPSISLASICAKVSRDALVVRESSNYPQYGLDIHKGYGTKMHLENIKKHGLSPFHRRSFCKNIMVNQEV
ncbi:MAG: rnhB [Candidatus Kaiserbacteria bacterium]|nr:rnhB [Candidatus Kaiserbacteria bacterium]